MSSSDEYEVGYGKPPAQHRFKAGNRGGGRRKGDLNRLTKLLHRGLAGSADVKQDGQVRRMKRLDLFAHQLVAKALAGDLAAMAAVFGYCGQLGALQPDPNAEGKTGVLVLDDDISEEEFLAKYGPKRA